MDLKDWQVEVHKLAVEKGWWDRDRPVPELLCLVHSELSEALEAHRRRNRRKFGEELADTVIRILDMAEGLGINLEEEVYLKHKYNKRRPYRHGGKRC